ncbi:MAG: pyridoxal phosphate-dependent aminotransferase [Acidimicrobiales bacterium]
MVDVSRPSASGASGISARAAAVTESVTLAVDAKAKALLAAGEDVIGFGAGEPDFPTPDHIVDAAAAACADPRSHHYSPAAGLPELRQAIAAKTLRDSGYSIQPSQVLVTNGGKHAIYEAFATLLDPGDEVLLPAPYWTTYPEAIRLAGGVPVTVAATAANGFRVTVDQLEAARTKRTKALVHVSPSNPSGAVYPPDEVEAVGRWADGHGLWVLTDEIYEHLTYGPITEPAAAGARRPAVSMPVAVPGLAGRCIVVNGVAKTYAMTGWRVGWLIGPPAFTKAAANLQSHSTSNVANVSQRAAIAALTGDLSAVEHMRQAFDRRRRRIWALLNDIDGITCAEPQGAFYAFPDLTGLLSRDLGGTKPPPRTTVELAEVVLEQARVAFVPGEAFGAPGYGRFSFALSDQALEEGVTRIAKLVAGGGPAGGRSS